VLIYLLHWRWPPSSRDDRAGDGRQAGRRFGQRRSGRGFVDEVANLLRSQVAGIAGNLAGVVPVVLLARRAWLVGAGRTPGREKTAHYVLHSIHLLGRQRFYAAFTGVLLLSPA
jgi:site-specific recombinase